MIGLLASCSGGEPDPSVQFEMQAAPFQPWVASGELVDAGEICPEGTRTNVGLAHPDGSPMTLEEWMDRVEEGEETGASMRDIFGDFWFIGWKSTSAMMARALSPSKRNPEKAVVETSLEEPERTSI